MRLSSWPFLGLLMPATLAGMLFLGRGAPASSVIAVADLPPEAAAPALPDLPTVSVGEHPVHAVAEDRDPGGKPFTFLDRNGQVLKRPPPPARHADAAASGEEPPPLTGTAEAFGSATLSLGGHPVRLYGVRAPEPRDRCAFKGEPARNCGDVAVDALAARIEGHPVTCRLPPGQKGAPAAVCRDGSGTDLGGFLVAEGFALAEPKEGKDYLGAQGVARSFRRGLWRYR